MSGNVQRGMGGADEKALVAGSDGARSGLLGPRVLVSVGTDSHPFDRLVDWMDDWMTSTKWDSGDPGKPRVTLQYGTSRPPVVVDGSPLMAHDELVAAMAQASAIVTHGGPATIRDARSVGLRPLVVPREPGLGEHVDDHQIRFTRMLAQSGEIVLCRERAELTSALDRAITDNSWLRLDDDARSEETAAAIARVGAILDAVVQEERQRRARRVRGGPARRWRRG